MKALIVLLFISVQTGPARPQEIGIIAGVIRSSDGAPAPGVRVFARPTVSVSEDQTVLEAQTETDASGRYHLEIAPGEYNVGTGVLASPTWYPGTIDITTARAVAVSGSATISLDITALPTSAIAGNIQVQIVSAVTGAPMEGVTVGMSGTVAPPPMLPGQRRASVPRPAPAVSVVTDASGNAVLRSLAPGRYNIQPRFSGYIRPNALVVSIDQTHISQRLQITLTPNAAISGRVIGSDGKPLGATQVWAGTLQYMDGRRKLVAQIRAQTDAQGAYRLAPLEPGAYYVVAETTSQNLGFGSAYFPGTTNLDDATLVSIRDAEDLKEVEFKAPKVTTYSVSGNVQNTAGTRISTFNLTPGNPGTAEAPQPIVIANGAATPDGTFVLRGIPPGSWNVFPVMPAPVRRAGHVEIIDRDVRGVEITPNPVTDVRGHIAMPDGAAVPSQVAVWLVPRASRPGNVVGHLTAPQTARPPDGGFLFAGVPPGQYSIRLSGVPPDYHVAGLSVGNTSIFEAGVIEVGASAIEPLEVTLANGGGSFRGFFNVTLAWMNADQLRNVRVTLVPSGPRRSNFALYQTLTIPKAGEPFGFSGVVPGDYKVFAWSKLPEGAEKSPEFLKRYEEYGTEVHVTAGHVDDVQVSLIAMP